MASINDGYIRRFEDGGKIIIRRAGEATDLVVMNILAGTVNLTPGVRQTLDPDVDRGVLLPRIRKGNMQPTLLDFDVKYTADQDADDLFTLLNDDGDGEDANYLPAYDIDVIIPDGPDKLTGEIFEITGASRREVYPFVAGEQYDIGRARFVATGWSRDEWDETEDTGGGGGGGPGDGGDPEPIG